MKRIKKIIAAINIFFIGIMSKVYATKIVDIEPVIPKLYGPPEPSKEEIAFQNKIKMGKIIVPILLFIIGIVVLFNKKLSKKVKAIIIGILVILGVGSYFLLNYIKEMGTSL